MSDTLLKDATETLRNAAAPILPAGNLSPANPPEGWLKWTEVEKESPDEPSKIEQLSDIIKKVVEINAATHGKGMRGTHVKTQALVKGNLVVAKSLPEHLQQGIFKTPGASYPIVARFANEPSHIQPDTVNGPRGVGIKVFNVTGEFLEGAEGHSQDLFFNNAQPLELRNLDTALEIFRLRLKHWDDPNGLQAELKKRPDASLQLAPGSLPNLPIIGQTMFTQSAFRFGPYVAHLSIAPLDPAQTSLSTYFPLPPTASATALQEQLHAYFTSHSAAYTIRAQFASSLTDHDVEDAGAVWYESTAPWFDLGTLEFQSQESYSTDRRDWWENQIALSPWNALKDHQPLGSIIRLRKNIYAASRALREGINKKKVYFPASPDEIPN